MRYVYISIHPKKKLRAYIETQTGYCRRNDHMAFRAAPSLRFRATYEEFQPKSETTDTPQAHILQIHLPGFVIEQVRIRYVSTTNMMRISGERRIAGINKWTRFRQAYPVPEICDAKKLKAKFDQGILTITMPKKIVPQVASPQQEVKTPQEKAPSPFEEPAAETKPQKAQMETPPKSTSTFVEEPRDEKRVSTVDLKAPSPSKEAAAESKAEKERVETPPKSTPTSVEVPRYKRSASLTDLKTPSLAKEAAAESKAEKERMETPPKSTSTSVEEPRYKRSASMTDLKTPSPAKEAVEEPKAEKEQMETPSKPTPTSVEEPRDKRSVSFADLKAPSPTKEAAAEQKTEKAKVETPPTSTVEEPRDKKSVSFTKLEASMAAKEAVDEPKTEKEEVPDIKKPADDKRLKSLILPEPIKELTQVSQAEILQKPTEPTAYPKLQTSVVQKGEEFEPKPTLPLHTEKQTDENTEKSPEEILPKATSTIAPPGPKMQINDMFQKALEDFMQKPRLRTVPQMLTDENIVGKRAEDAKDKEVKEPLAEPFEPGMPEKGTEKDMVKATDRKESRVFDMVSKPYTKTPEKEKEATGEAASPSIYKEKHTKNIIDTIGKGIKEVAASTSDAVTNIPEHKLKDEEKNLLSMVMAALAAHVSYRLTSSGKPQN